MLRLRFLAYPLASRMVLLVSLFVFSLLVLTAGYLPFESRLDSLLDRSATLVYAGGATLGIVLVVSALLSKRLIAAIYVGFLIGLFAVTLGKNVKELASQADPLGANHPVISRVPGDSLLELVQANNMFGSELYVHMYAYYRDRTLVAPTTLLNARDLRPSKFIEWGGMQAVTLRDYDPALTEDEAQTLRQLPYHTVETYSGERYVLITTSSETSMPVWLVSEDDAVFVVPRGLLPERFVE